MKPLQPIPQCVECLKSLARGLLELNAPENSALVEKVELATRNILEDAAGSGPNSPRIANRILREIKQITGIADPYAEFKAGEMAQACRIITELEGLVADNLRSRAALAALGNSLDFFHNPSEALADIPALFRNGFSFYCDLIDRLETFLTTRPEKVLYLTDNAGEIYFDLPLYDYLKKYCRRLNLVVKGGPSLNDLTRLELQSAKLQDRFDEVSDTGTDGVGIDWDNVSGEFIQLFESADLVISKGMANFETLYPENLSMPAFFLFKVKCEPIQNYVQAPLNSYMALWKEGNSNRRRATQA